MNSIATKNRLYHIDRLKVLGLLLVILAHVDLPVWLAQIRSFDVPLLVFVSAYLARRSYKDGSVISYYQKRFFRLAVPAWIFAIVFWIVQSVILAPPSSIDIVKGITFQRDTNMLGMLWVIWVYIVCALLIPLINKLNCSFKIYGSLILLLVLFQILCSYTTLSDNRFLYCTVFTVIPYGFTTFLGYYYGDMKKKSKIILSIGSAVVFGVMTIVLWYKDCSIFPITDYKYPAQIYFLSYAIPIISLLFWLMPMLDNHKTSCLVQFISKSSLWIYLWHILVLYAVKMFISNSEYWWLQYVIIVLISVCITWVQNKVIDFLLSKYKWKLLSVFKG